jgi:hypothetical protein
MALGQLLIGEQLRPGEYGIPQGALARCPPSGRAQELDAKVTELDRTWHPTGYYSWGEMAELIAAAIKLTNYASTTTLQAFRETDWAVLRSALEEYNKVAERALTYTEIWQKARATGAIINAPGFRRWVIELLNASKKLMRIAEVSICATADKPWFYTAMGAFMSFFDGVVNTAKRIGRLAAKVGDIVLDAADTALGLWPVAKWSAIGIGVLFLGVFIWSRLQATAEAGRRPFDWSRLVARFKLRQSTDAKVSHG